MIFPLLRYENQISIMAATGQIIYFVRISTGAKSNVMHSIKYLLDTGARTNLISKDVVPAHWLPKMVELISKPINSAPKDQLKTMGSITSNVSVGNLNAPCNTR